MRMRNATMNVDTAVLDARYDCDRKRRKYRIIDWLTENNKFNL